MQFKSKITKQDFVRAYWLNAQSGYRTLVTGFIYASAAVLWSAIVASRLYVMGAPKDQFAGQIAGMLSAVLLPAAVGLVLWILGFRVLLPALVRRRYSRSGLDGIEVVQSITDEGFQQTPSSTAATFTPWARFSCWRESKEQFLVCAYGDNYSILPKSALTAGQQSELRAILSKSLRKR